MNTWPEKNLMTMTSDVRNKTLAIETPTKQNVRCARSVCNFDLCLLCPNWTNFCLMASSPYGCFDLILLSKILTSSYDT